MNKSKIRQINKLPKYKLSIDERIVMLCRSGLGDEVDESLFDLGEVVEENLELLTFHLKL